MVKKVKGMVFLINHHSSQLLVMCKIYRKEERDEVYANKKTIDLSKYIKYTVGPYSYCCTNMQQ